MNRLIKKVEKKVLQSFLRSLAKWALLQFSQNDPIAVPRNYMILYDKESKPVSIKCLTCGMTSFNKYDIKNKYCGHCKQFHS